MQTFLSLRVGAIVALAATLAPPPTAAAQASTRSVPETYAITNATIVPGTGATIAQGTVVVRNGLIAAVGANVKAPADARIVDGTGLTVYPGLIDAFGSLGIPAAAPANGGRGAASFVSAPQPQPSADHPVGITPEVLAVDLIKVGDAEFNGPRSAGITTALSAPTVGFLSGRAALIDLSDESVDDAVLESPAAMAMSYGRGGRGGGIGRGGYPGSLLGVFAAFRQEMLDAQRYGQWKAMYDRNPRGTPRPPMDAGLEALQPVVNGQMPVIFEANSAREIARSLGLAKEFKLKAIIAGGAEADQVAADLKAANVPVILSLNFPQRSAAASSPDSEPELLSVLEARVNAPKVAGKLARAGVRFAFESGGLTNWADFLGNAGKSVAAGLSASDALRAMTLAPAEIFGVSQQTGSLEVGKIANLTVTRGALFEPGSKVVTVFVDGAEIVPQAPANGRGRGGMGR